MHCCDGHLLFSHIYLDYEYPTCQNSTIQDIDLKGRWSHSFLTEILISIMIEHVPVNGSVDLFHRNYNDSVSNFHSSE